MVPDFGVDTSGWEGGGVVHAALRKENLQKGKILTNAGQVTVNPSVSPAGGP
jgi:hypothetical protein